MPDVVIITTGDELLYGTTADTNSSFISSQLFGTNFKVIKHVTISDDLNTIASCLKQSVTEADIIIMTGGLGPTDDDNTVDAVCKVVNTDPVIDKESEKSTGKFFSSMNISTNTLDSKMSAVPRDSYVIQNRYGLAPGFIVNHTGKIIISLPGVPAESEKMFNLDVLPYLEKNFSFRNDLKLNYRMSGIRESDINIMVNRLNLPDSIRIGITSKSGVCDLIITGFENDLNSKINIDILIKNEFSKYLLMDGTSSPEEELVYLLKQKGLTISTAESCTGGLIAKRITDIAGSSEVYIGSIVAYSNDIKKTFLDVSDETLDNYGAVSENTAAEMVISIKNKFSTGIAVSTTGIAGPGGGSESKPVGMVCFGFLINGHLETVTRQIEGNRERVRTFSALYAINFLREYLKNAI